MQKAGLNEDAKPPRKTPISFKSNEKQLPSFEAAAPYPEKLFLKQAGIDYSLSRHLKRSKFCRFEKGEAYVDQM